MLGTLISIIGFHSFEFLKMSFDCTRDILDQTLYKSRPEDGRRNHNNTRTSNRNWNYSTHFSDSSEVRHVGFLKVHKAGSTTIQNMLFRFGLKRNLTFVIAKHGPYFSWDGILPIKAGSHYDIFAIHTFYKKKQFDKLLPKDKINIAVVREPLSRTISAAHYFRDVFPKSHPYLERIPKTHFIKELLLHPEKYEKRSFSYTKNAMAKDFGFDENTKQTDTVKINEKLNSLDKEFKLVMIMERLHESLVLLKRYLNWSIKDIIYLRTNSHKHAITNVTEEEILKHKQTCFLDYAIYDFFSKKFNKRVDAEGAEFQTEVRQFAAVLKQATYFCDKANATDAKTEIAASEWNDMFIISKYDCDQMNLGLDEFQNSLRIRHTKMHDIR